MILMAVAIAAIAAIVEQSHAIIITKIYYYYRIVIIFNIVDLISPYYINAAVN